MDGVKVGTEMSTCIRSGGREREREPEIWSDAEEK